MKKSIYAAMLCTAIGFSACEDYLTVKSPDQLTSSTFWRNEADAEAGLAAAYSQLEYSIDTWEFAEVKWPVEAYREDVVILGSDALNYQNWVELSTFNYTNGNSQFSAYWRCNYSGISYANQVIEKVAQIPESAIRAERKAQIVNEAYFLRAYYHFKLLLNWEQIVVRDAYITSQEQLAKPLSSREEAWEMIIADLTKATSLPSTHTSENVGRATSGAAYAYLGYAYLTRAYEESAKKSEYLEKAISALKGVTGYALEEDYISMFNGTNKNCKESVFELQFTMNSSNGANYRNALHRWIGVAELWGWDEIAPSEFLYREFMKEGATATTGRFDSRMYETMFFQCDYFNDETGRVYGYNYDEWFSNDEGAYNRPAFRKFMPADYAGLEQSRVAINIPLMRYSNVLLMLAEAYNESGQTSLAIPLINEVRAVHGDMPPMSGSSAEAIRAQIEHERILEFPLENLRWYDLRRWGKLTEAMQAAGRNGFNESENSFYPIPMVELNSNNQIK
ncbi:MAG: RagB/SusD family nutrient uptake outer membrane protein [Bacteroidales bacterium]